VWGLAAPPEGGGAGRAAVVPPAQELAIYFPTKINFVVNKFAAACFCPADLPLLHKLRHRAPRLLLALLTRDVRVPLARGALAVPPAIPDRDDRGSVLPEVGRKGRPHTRTTGWNPGSCRVALPLRLDRFDRQGRRGALALPTDRALGPSPRRLLPALLDPCPRLRRPIHPPLLAPCARPDLPGLWRPSTVRPLELGALGNAPPTAEHAQKQGAVPRRVELGTPALDLLTGERFGAGTPPPPNVTGLDGVPHHPRLIQTKINNVLQGIAPAVHRRPRAAVGLVVLDKLRDRAAGALGAGDRNRRKDEAERARRTRDGGCRDRPARHVRPQPGHGGLTDGIQRLPPLALGVCGALGHRRSVWRAFGPVIQRRLAARDSERAVAPPRFDAFQGGPGLAPRRGKRLPPRGGRRGLREAGPLQVAGQAVAELPGTAGQAALARHAAGKDLGRGRGPEPPPRPEAFGDVGRPRDHALPVALTVRQAQGALGASARRPGQAAHFPPRRPPRRLHQNLVRSRSASSPRKTATPSASPSGRGSSCGTSMGGCGCRMGDCALGPWSRRQPKTPGTPRRRVAMVPGASWPRTAAALHASIAVGVVCVRSC
jgi:hypothetical protein